MTTDPTGKAEKRPLFDGKYEILHHIASGGMGRVYKARDIELDREVALKVLPPDMANKPGVAERFRREAKAAARLHHENIVAIYDFGEAARTYYLALEFVNGIDLYEYIKQRGRLEADDARELLKQAAKALGHAHSMGIVHRDIKPSNFLITEKEGRPLLKLTDLGLARQAREEEARVTRDGTTVGTVDYISPEQANDSSKADIRSDIYSLGCTFYHMLAGQPPFPDGTLIERLSKHINVEPPDIARLNADVPPDLRYVLDRMLKKKPEDRYQTPLELLRDLLNPEQIPAEELRRAPVQQRPPPEKKPRPAPAVPPEPRKKPSDAAQAKERPAASRVVRAEESAAEAEKPRPAKKRLRDDAVEEAPPSLPSIKYHEGQRWLLWAAIGAFVLLALIVLIGLLAWPTDKPKTKDSHRGQMPTRSLNRDS